MYGERIWNGAPEGSWQAVENMPVGHWCGSPDKPSGNAWCWLPYYANSAAEAVPLNPDGIGWWEPNDAGNGSKGWEASDFLKGGEAQNLVPLTVQTKVGEAQNNGDYPASKSENSHPGATALLACGAGAFVVGGALLVVRHHRAAQGAEARGIEIEITNIDAV